MLSISDKLIKNTKTTDVPTRIIVVDLHLDLEEKEDTIILINTVRWNDININSGSTQSLESAMFGRPVVILGFNGYKPVPWHKSVGTGLMFTHYGYILSSGGVWRVNNERELIDACRAYIQDPSIHKEGRKRLVENVAGILDGKSGKRFPRI